MPFPTTLWLSCRVLVRAVGELESAAASPSSSASSPRGRDCARAAAAPMRASPRCARRSTRGGPRADGGAALTASLEGGARGAPLKCLHAHAAVALGAPPYALGRLVLERARRRRCRGAAARGRERAQRAPRARGLAQRRALVERVLADPARAPVATQRACSSSSASCAGGSGRPTRSRRSCASTAMPTAGRAPPPSASRPGVGWAQDASFADAACARAARNARDWTPG